MGNYKPASNYKVIPVDGAMVSTNNRVIKIQINAVIMASMILFMSMRYKCPHSELFQSVFSLIRTEYSPNEGKYGLE